MAKKMICSTCGSENVVKDAWASWDETIQEWVLDSIFDNSYCNKCEGETKIIKKNDE